MLGRSRNRRKRRAEAAPPAHRFDALTDFCTQCGAHRSSVWFAAWPVDCPAGANAVGISHLLARRHLATARRCDDATQPQPRPDSQMIHRLQTGDW
jgi:hypothetical protein